jgi:hypothetical protein
MEMITVRGDNGGWPERQERAESGPTAIASGRTGVFAIAGIPLRA